MPDRTAPLLLIADVAALPRSERVWGTGGRLDPGEREGLDWLTLARLAGWGVDLAEPDAASMRAQGIAGRRWVIVAGDAATLSAPVVDLLRSWLVERAVTVIARASPKNALWSELAGVAAGPEGLGGRKLSIAGSNSTWSCRNAFAAQRVRASAAARPFAFADNEPIAYATPVGLGLAVTLAFAPSAVRDANGAATRLVREILIRTSHGPLAWFDFSNTLALRMDDPGTAQNVHLDSWRYLELDETAWTRIGAELAARGARLSVGWAGGWADDGDATRGALTVAGRRIAREPGRVHASAEVVYDEFARPASQRRHDYAGQYRALRALAERGTVDITLHGHTHMHPDTAAWAAAADRYEDVGWFRELGARAQPFLDTLGDAHPLVLGARRLRHDFGRDAMVLICPGDEWTDAALVVALDLGLCAVSNGYFAIRHDDRFCWVQHVCAPYLDRPDPSWFDSGLPVVGYFHDRDVSLHGIGWMTRALDEWSTAGARRFVALRDIALASQATLAIAEGEGSHTLVVRSDPAVTSSAASSVRLPVRYHLGDADAVNGITVGCALPIQSIAL